MVDERILGKSSCEIIFFLSESSRGFSLLHFSVIIEDLGGNLRLNFEEQ